VDSRQEVKAAGTAFGRPARLAAAAFVAVVIITGFLLSRAPDATDSSQKIFSYLAHHQGQLQATAVLAGLAATAVLVWVSGVFRALSSVEGGTPGPALAALGGGVLAAASTVTLALIGGTTAIRFNDLGPAGARVFWTMFVLSRGAILVGLAAVIGATAVACWRAQPFRWFTVPSAVMALASVAGACAIGYPELGVVTYPVLFFDGVWILVSSYLWP
jgi:hypothetical protein